MIELSDEQKAAFFQKSYTSVDGLWFVKMEEKHGFNSALDVDDEVWRVMPKIQARELKKMTGLDKGLDALFECLSTKFSLEGYDYEAKKRSDGSGFTILIRKCPWYDIMVKSGRESLAPKVGPRICWSEYNVWAREFGEDIQYELLENICSKANQCVMNFSVSP